MRVANCISEPVATTKGTLPSAGADLLTTAITPFYSQATLRVDFAPSVAGALTVTYTKSGVTTTSKLYGGSDLAAGGLYAAEILVTDGETVNFQFSGTGGTYRLIVREV